MQKLRIATFSIENHARGVSVRSHVGPYDQTVARGHCVPSHRGRAIQAETPLVASYKREQSLSMAVERQLKKKMAAGRAASAEGSGEASGEGSGYNLVIKDGMCSIKDGVEAKARGSKAQSSDDGRRTESRQVRTHPFVAVLGATKDGHQMHRTVSDTNS
jgi:hypothetical protein